MTAMPRPSALQPLQRFPELDAAILFSDILIVPFAIGQNSEVRRRRGPAADPAAREHGLSELTGYPARLDPIYETVAKVKARLDPDKTLIGFAGSPWTVATYMVAGQGSRDQAEARRLAYRRSRRLSRRSSRRIEASHIDYLPDRSLPAPKPSNCLTAGREALSPTRIRTLGDRADRAARSALGAHPRVPIIGFPKGAGGKLAAYARETRSMRWASTKRSIRSGRTGAAGRLPVQGNLDPLALLAGGEALRRRAAHP